MVVELGSWESCPSYFFFVKILFTYIILYYIYNMKSQLKLNVFQRKSDIRKDGTAQLICKISCGQTISEIGMGIYLKPASWNQKSQQSTVKSINDFITQYKSGITIRYYEKLMSTVLVKSSDLLDSKLNKTKLSDSYVTYMAMLTGAQATKDTYGYVLAKIISFGDIEISAINDDWLLRFEFYLKGCLSNNSVALYLNNIKSVLSSLNINSKIIKPKFKYATINYLTYQEVTDIEEAECKSKNQEIAKDLFLFAVSTGVSYADLYTVEFKNGWIVGQRRKTGVEFTLPLLAKASQIVAKYAGKLPQMNIQLLNNTLKSFNKDISFHTSRHTFATNCLNSGVSMEVVSKVMGHSNISSTQKYAKVLTAKIENEFTKLI